MYYPYLRGRQFELIALRELASENQIQNAVVPVIEPVKKSINNLNLAYKIFLASEQNAYIIVNPQVGEMSGDNEYYLEYISPLDSNIYQPAFLYRNNSNYINTCINKFNLSECMIISSNEIQDEDQSFRTLVNSENVSHVIVEDPDKNRGLRRFLKESGNAFIRLDDLFETQPRNSNFLEIGAHRFSEEHQYYNSDGGYNGFSDYTILSSAYNEGGSTPRAVVIHLTYLNDHNQIWIRHFTSNTNDSIANVQGKFGEAAHKAINFCQDNGLSNSAIIELQDYYDRGHYPGLGTVKKIAIKNHLIVVSDYLKSL